MSNLKNVDFNIIRYANCWEDADLLTQALQADKNSKILSIGSAGDNSFSLLLNNPKLVLAIDISQVQIHLIELKKVAIKNLSRIEYLAFAGFTQMDDRLRWITYNCLSKDLPTETKAFWDERKKIIENGIIFSGKFEKYFKIFSEKVLPYIHSKNTIKVLKSFKNSISQESFYLKKWNNRRWQFLFKLFFSKRVMALLGRDPVFLKQVKIPVSEFIFNKTAQHLKSVHAQNNHILDFALEGKFSENLPHYVREENYEKIRKNIDRLACHHGLLQTAFEKHGKFDYFNLSNIFEYLDNEEFTSLKNDIVAGANKNAKIAYWNLMVDRKLSSIDNTLKELFIPSEMKMADKGFFYKNFHLDIKVA